MTRPVWLLDVDGVLNASRAGWGRAPRAATVRAHDMPFRIRWEPSLVTRIVRMHQADAVEIRWATSLVGSTPQLEAALGLPAFPLAFDPEVPDILRAKREAALYWAGSGRRLIWTDDNAFPPLWTPRGYLEDDGHLLIAPSSTRGLRPEDMDRIEAYCGM